MTPDDPVPFGTKPSAAAMLSQIEQGSLEKLHSDSIPAKSR